MIAVQFAGVSKRFRAPTGRPRTLKEWLLGQARPTAEANFWALRDLTLAVLPGQTIGLIGRNGSGKSTALKLVAGIMKPTSGHLAVKGRVGALLELGAGFHPEFSGRENVFLNASLLGLSRKETARRLPAIVDFAELAAFIDAPVKTYSSGMAMRLAFAVAIHLDPDVLLIDEVFAVGDAAFQRKCFEEIRRFRREGKTIMLVTHDAAAVRMLCDRAIWLEAGRIMADGPPAEVLERYAAGEADLLSETGPTSSSLSIGAIAFAGEAKGPGGAWPSGQAFTVDFPLVLSGDPGGLAMALKIVKSDGICCYTSEQQLPATGPVRSRVQIVIPRLDLLSGAYIVEISVVAGPLYLDVRKQVFEIFSPVAGEGIAPLLCHWKIAAEPPLDLSFAPPKA